MIDYVSKGLVNLQCIRKKVFTMDLLGVKGKALYPANVCVCVCVRGMWMVLTI